MIDSFYTKMGESLISVLMPMMNKFKEISNYPSSGTICCWVFDLMLKNTRKGCAPSDAIELILATRGQETGVDCFSQLAHLEWCTYYCWVFDPDKRKKTPNISDKLRASVLIMDHHVQHVSLQNVVSALATFWYYVDTPQAGVDCAWMRAPWVIPLPPTPTACKNCCHVSVGSCNCKHSTGNKRKEISR